MTKLSDSRNGNFTSSEIYRLMSKSGKKTESFWSYIEECNMERRLGRSIDAEVNSRPITWGKCCENLAFAALPLSYRRCSTTTLVHPEFTYWLGTPDVTAVETVGDIKSPHTMKSLCQLLDPGVEMKDGKTIEIHKPRSIEALRWNHKDGEKYYWQLVSNAILTESKYAELIAFCPHKDDLDGIRQFASTLGKEYQWIVYASDDELPYLVDNKHYKKLNHVFFEVPQRDKDALTENVIEAGKYLIAA